MLESEIRGCVLSVNTMDSTGLTSMVVDLKTACDFGIFASGVVTSFDKTLLVTPDIVRQQLLLARQKLSIDAVKIGFLGSVDMIKALAETIKEWQIRHVVVDPIMMSSEGQLLVPEFVREAYRKYLFPVATVVTPNLPELAYLFGVNVSYLTSEALIKNYLQRFYLQQQVPIIVKGFLTRQKFLDFLFDGQNFVRSEAEYLKQGSTLGTGCRFAMAVTATLAKGMPLPRAFFEAKTYVTKSLEVLSLKKMLV